MILKEIKSLATISVGRTDIVEYTGIPCLVVALSQLQGYGLVALEGAEEGKIIKEYKTHLDLQFAKLNVLVKGDCVCISRTEPINIKVPF